jgi:glycine dehydrogenase subunit 2
MKKSMDTGYHAVTWNEPIIYELGSRGRRGSIIPRASDEIRNTVGDVISKLPKKMRRKTPPSFPELSEPEIVRHFLRLSQQTFGTDSGINAGVGTCTMKYNPKINEVIARSVKLSELHPLQDESTVQGILEIMYELNKWLCEISGMNEFSMQPRGGAHAVFTNASIIRAFHKSNDEHKQRREIITTVLSHPCNASSPGVAGFKIITLYPNPKTGIPDIEALKAAVSKQTAGMMFTDPYDTGVFDNNLKEYIDIIHEIGGLVAIDQANANSVLGRLRIGDAGADLCHFNLHKSFSTPHGSCGPGCAPIGVKENLSKFLPVPIVSFDGSRYYFDYNRPQSIGKIGSFHGVIPNVLRAYVWILSMGIEGIKEVSEVAVINNNYLIKKLLSVKGISLPWYESHPFRMQEARFTLEKMYNDTGIDIGDLNRRIVDFGVQRCFTAHEPWIISQPFTPEPPETIPLEDLDRFVEILHRISNEAYECPDTVKSAPHNCSISQVDLSSSIDPEKWATTWRAYLKKNR